MPELTVPTTRVHASYLRAIAEYQVEGGYPDFDEVILDAPEAFALYVNQLLTDPRAMTLLWWTDGTDYLGRISIWHQLTGGLADNGHIGYDVRPSARGRGHATAMLAAALPVVGKLGIDPALVTVRARNTASRRVIEANGGRLIKQNGDRLYFHLSLRRSGGSPLT